MNLAGTHNAVRRVQGFEAYLLRSQALEIAVVPELGARLISLKDLRSGREWLWYPGKEQKLFRNTVGDRFENGPLVGIDECFPTIGPCAWRGRHLPDHGELWAARWTVDRAAWEAGGLRTRASLEISPFDFSRQIELCENEVRFRYEVVNRNQNDEAFLWAMHPLLRLQPGDQLHLPASTQALLNGAGWIKSLDVAIPVGGCEKLFAGPVSDGVAAIHNLLTGDRLALEWNVSENNTLGLWLTRGGWHGHHHFALEPTNGQPDALSVAAQRQRCGIVAAGGSASWQVVLRLGE